MAIATADMRRRDQLLIRLRDAWDDLSTEEQSAVEVLVNSVILNHGGVEEALFPALSDSELYERIDRGIAEAEAGVYVDSGLFEDKLAAEFGLA